jgi:membrane protein implicated in regulation of membrane protease activity
MNPTIIWFIVGIILIILELFAPGMILIWFGMGALAAGFSSYLINSIILQLVIFIIISLSFLLFVRKYTIRLEKTPPQVGSERFIGEKAKVIKKIKKDEYGYVIINGEEWRATSNIDIDKNEWVLVEKIEGTHFIVKPKMEENK